MSFNQFPQIDRYSENEDKSNSYFRLHFAQHNGFLVSKPEDKGCDFVVELIRDRKSTNWRFPVQLKSIEQPNFIENGAVISYCYEVSRLRYMLEPIPPVGLIILYWPENNWLYYDYAEKIYARLLEKREGNMAWKSQENVNIHIPVINTIDDRNLKLIYNQIMMRHHNSTDRSSLLYPEISSSIPTKAELQELPSSNVVSDVLQSHGLEMFYNNEIPKLSQLLDQTPIKLLREDSRLSLLAGITYSTMGLPVDASFFLEKALHNESISAEDFEHAAWTKLCLDSYLGKISLQEFKQQVNVLLQELSPGNEPLRLKYELCIARTEVDLLSPTNLALIFDLANKFIEFNQRITAATLSAKSTIHYYLQNVTNLGILLITADSVFRWRIAKDRQNGIKIDPEVVAEMEMFVARVTNEVESVFPLIKPLARNFVHSIMLADCYESQVSIQLKLDLNALRYPIRRFDFQEEKHIKRLLLHTAFAKEALEIFAEHQFYMNAYNMTLMLMELSEFAAYSNLTLDLDLDAIRQQAECFRQQLALPPWQIEAKELILAYGSHPHSYA